MIDWVNVTFNTLWICGLAVILAAFSYHDWLAHETGFRLRDILSQCSWRVPFAAGVLLTSVGLGYGVAGQWWERAIWAVLAFFYACRLVMSLKTARAGDRE